MDIFKVLDAIYGKNEAPIRDVHIVWQVIERAGLTDRYTVEVNKDQATCKIVSIN